MVAFSNQSEVKALFDKLDDLEAMGAKVILGTITLSVNGQSIVSNLDEAQMAMLRDISLSYVARDMRDIYLELLENFEVTFSDADVYTTEGVRTLLMARYAPEPSP